MPDRLPETDGNNAQIRAIAKAMVEAANFEYQSKNPQQSKQEMSPPLKWASAIVAGLMTVGSAGLLFWMVNTISDTQIIVMEIKTRQEMTAAQWEEKFKSLDARMGVIEEQVRHNAAARSAGRP